MESGGARVALNVGGDIVAVSEAVVSDEEWTRVEVTYTHPASAQTAVMYPCLQSCGKGYAYFDAVQCEQSANASRYNLIENGDFTWSDLLTSIGGQSLTADEIGNLLSDGTWTYTWQHGRQLAGMSKTGMNIAYGYDSDGRRITKTVNDTTYNYHYLGDQLVELTWGSNKLHFTYDSTGPLSVNCNGTEYFYVKNAQGDVTGLVNASGTRVVTYTYDAWGNPLTTTGSLAATLGAQNPLRYRGYVYDTETGLYYLQSRYYNPAWGRFINADSLIDNRGVHTQNVFAYCGNNPISNVDDDGQFLGAIAIGFAIGIVGQYIADVHANISSGVTEIGILKPRSRLLDYVESGVGGAIAAIPGLSYVGTVAVGAIGSVVTDGLKGNIHSAADLGNSLWRGGVANTMGYIVSRGLATVKVKQIDDLSRSAKKIFIRDDIYNGSPQGMVNANLHTYDSLTKIERIYLVESKLAVFRSGLYSTITSTCISIF